MSSAARVREHRRRKREGVLLVLHKWDDEKRDVLVEMGVLQEWDRDDPDAVEQALDEALVLFRAGVTRYSWRAVSKVGSGSKSSTDGDPE